MKKRICSLLITSGVVVLISSTQFFGASRAGRHFTTSTSAAIALGYTPSAGSGLTLKLSSGSTLCQSTIQAYAGGTLTMAANATNYVYIMPLGGCVPGSSTTYFTRIQIPLAEVVTNASAITSISDVREISVASGISGAGTCASNQFATAVNTATGPTCVQPSFSNLSGTASVAQLPVATTSAEGIVELAGDLAGTAAAPTVSKLQGRAVSTTAPATNQVLTWNGSAWTPASATGGTSGSGTTGMMTEWTGSSGIGNSPIKDASGTLTSTEAITAPSIATTGSGTPTVQLGASGPSWTTGSGAPTGSCTRGSLYSNTTGSSGSTLYVCVNSAWVDSK
jgi:hypothetical protein